jgi:cytochrome P450
MNPEELDPPEHTEFRNVLNGPLSPKRIRGLEGRIRARCVELIDAIAAGDGCDLMTEFAYRYPTTLFLELFGLPTDKTAEFIEEAHTVLNTPNSDDLDGSIRTAAAGRIIGHLAQAIAEHRAHPTDDLMSEMLQAKVFGRDLTDAELYDMGFLLFTAGLDTVANMLGFSFRHLAQHPAARRALVDEPEKMPNAVEEFLRMFSLATTVRVVTRDVEFAGCPMKENDRVILPTVAAGRDPEEFPNPDAFDIDRADTRHLAFGAGPHRCVGSHLARLELLIALEEWHKRIPEYRIPDGAQFDEHVGAVAGFKSLPLEWRSR